MTPRPIAAAPAESLESVAFDAALSARIDEMLARYPTRRAAILPVLWLCQERFGWISPGVMRAVAERLGESPAFVEGIVTFYTMFYTSPPARYVLQVCTTLSCAVCGGRELVEHLKRRLGIGFGERTADGSFQLIGVQCLGACGGAPVVQINDDYYENLDAARLDAVLGELEGSR
ncbi:MAG TPA: NAD(P)H-dependent oxidoreductase subunit E [Thermoanaerobaculaceae bacterium]|nr:NAD(P)H-dependent oxidoreductase subunit E [Thermoanaerobaculaceae bacterium]